MLSYRPGRANQASVLSANTRDRRLAIDDGYFLLLASPRSKRPTPSEPKKTVVFVVDRSGSMSGEKIEQAKGALRFVLNNLHEGDLFNIIAFDSEVESWRPELQRFNDETRKKALGFVERHLRGRQHEYRRRDCTPRLEQLQDPSRPNIVLFMTDGLPTDGEQNEAKIVANSKEYNKVHARIFTFGVGFDLNSRLLDRLSSENFGQSEFVRPNENIETAVSALYRRISAPVLSDLKIAWDIDADKAEYGEPVNRVYPRSVHDLFAGEQLVLVGRYQKAGAAKVKISGTVDGKPQSFSFAANLVDRSGDQRLAFVEKLWAIRRVGDILNELDLKGKNEELVKELVTLSTRHGIITPYTSFLAEEPLSQGHQVPIIRNYGESLRATDRRLDALKETDGELGVEQRAAKAVLQNAASPAITEGSAGAQFDASTPLSKSGAGTDGGPVAAPRFSFAPAGGGGQDQNQSQGSVAVTGDKAQQSATKDAQNIAENVRHVGAKVFYRRGKQWVDSAITEEQQKHLIKIERYSRDYFDLVDRFGHDVAKYMTFDDPVIVEINGKAYSF